jgi:exopolysaccharide biosynthesis WecB/TagA/CpsF family protein
MAERNAQQKQFRVDDIAINLLSIPHAVRSVVETAERGRGFCLFTLNLDHCTKLKSDPSFRHAYQRATFVTADGFPIVLLGRMNGVPVQRATGSDLVEPLCREAALRQLPVFLLGPNAQVLRRAQTYLRQRSDALHIAGTYAPGPNFDPSSIDADLAIERIRQSGARICLVAIGAPRQEIFAARCLEKMPDVGFICVGAGLDFLAGTQARAPKFFRDRGLEWLWRLSGNPRRLAPRYMRCAAAVPRLAAQVIPHVISVRRGRIQ